MRDETVPQLLSRGEAAPFDGVLLSRELFNEYAPYFEEPGDKSLPRFLDPQFGQ